MNEILRNNIPIINVSIEWTCLWHDDNILVSVRGNK